MRKNIVMRELGVMKVEGEGVCKEAVYRQEQMEISVLIEFQGMRMKVD